MPQTYAPCEIILAFGDSDYLFKLPLKQIAELQVACGWNNIPSGIGAIYRRVMTGDYFIQDLHQTIRLALIGGGLDELKARMLCENYCETWPKDKLWDHARAILGACIQGYEPPPPKEAPGETQGEETTMTMGSSTSPKPTQTDSSQTEASDPTT